jgi:hypothetical protein
MGYEQAFAASLSNVGCPQQRPSASVTGSVQFADNAGVHFDRADDRKQQLS